MNRRIVAAAMATALSLSLSSTLHAARVSPFHHSASDKSSVGKMISFNVRNDTKSTLILKSGEQQFTIEAGKTATLKAAEGADLVNVNGSEKQAAGSVITKVSKQLQGNTLAVS